MSWTNGQSVRQNQPPFVDSMNEERTFNSQGNTYSQQGGYKKNHRSYSTQPNKDVAATFTQEGLQAFSTIFSSAVEAVLVKALPDLVEKAVERKVDEMSKQILLELHRVMENQLSSLREPISVQNISTSEYSQQSEMEKQFPEEALDTRLQGASSETKPQEDRLSKETTIQQSLHVNRAAEDGWQTNFHQTTSLAEDAKLVVDVMQKMDRPVRTNELPELIPDVYWGHNISMKMNKVMQKSAGRIERISKGLYVYRD